MAERALIFRNERFDMLDMIGETEAGQRRLSKGFGAPADRKQG